MYKQTSGSSRNARMDSLCGFLAGLALLSLIGSSTALKCYGCLDSDVIPIPSGLLGSKLPKCSEDSTESYECGDMLKDLGRMLSEGLNTLTEIPGKLLSLPGAGLNMTKGVVGGAVGAAKGVVGGAVGAAKGVVGGVLGGVKGLLPFGKKKAEEGDAGESGEGSARRKRDLLEPVCIKQVMMKGDEEDEGNMFVARYCLPISLITKVMPGQEDPEEANGCKELSGLTTCSCKTDLCNKGNPLSFSHLVIGGLLLITLYWNNFGFA